MSCLYYRGTQLYIENIRVLELAKEFGTPCYVYSRAAIENNWRSFNEAFSTLPHRICYAVKANSNLAILHLLAKLNAGFDIVSLGEMERVLAAGGDPQKIIFSGVGKTNAEIISALKKHIYCFNIESVPELERIHAITTQLNLTANIAIRINPNINPHTHSHITTGLDESKFGINISDVIPLAKKISSLSTLKLIGIASHIGSQIVHLGPFLQVVDRLLETYEQLQTIGISLKHINIGGGLGIIYHDEHPPGICEYANALKEKLSGYDLQLIMEPGRAIVGNAGILLSKIEYIKNTPHKNFAIIDAGMNDLLRPALYDAWQNILPVELRDSKKMFYDIAGPVCESADFLGKHRELALHEGDFLAIDSAGAYGFSMASNYNSRCRPPEVLVNDHEAKLVRPRETINELFATEYIAYESALQ